MPQERTPLFDLLSQNIKDKTGCHPRRSRYPLSPVASFVLAALISIVGLQLS